MTEHADLSSFLLIDAAQRTLAALPVPTPNERPQWLTHVYEDAAAHVSPMVIDIEAAHAAGELDRLSALANAPQPQLHASFIDTTLTHDELTQHLRHFIMVRNADLKAFTLRFADSAVLPTLSTVFTPEQWTALAGPFTRWCVHGLDGALHTLPTADNALTPEPTPLVLTDAQFAAMREAAAPTIVLSLLRDINHGVALPGSLPEQHRWAHEAHRVWRTAGNRDEVVLRWLISAALDTNGLVLQQRSIPALLAGPDRRTFRTALQSLIAVSQPDVHGVL